MLASSHKKVFFLVIPTIICNVLLFYMYISRINNLLKIHIFTSCYAGVYFYLWMCLSNNTNMNILLPVYIGPEVRAIENLNGSACITIEPKIICTALRRWHWEFKLFCRPINIVIINESTTLIHVSRINSRVPSRKAVSTCRIDVQSIFDFVLRFRSRRLGFNRFRYLCARLDFMLFSSSRTRFRKFFTSTDSVTVATKTEKNVLLFLSFEWKNLWHVKLLKSIVVFEFVRYWRLHIRRAALKNCYIIWVIQLHVRYNV